MINVETYPKAHNKGGSGGGTTVINNNGGSNKSATQNFKLINVETANINDLTAKSIKSNDAFITYLSAEDGSISKLSGKEISYDKATFGSADITNINADKINVNAIDVKQAIIDALKSKEITTDYLTVTKQAHFFELVIDKLKSVGGQIILTPTNSVADFVVDMTDDIVSEDSYYRVFFKATNSEGRAITNDWRLYDQAICQTFNNVVSGGTNQNKYYWRLVIGKNESPMYVDLTYGNIYGNGEPTWDHTLDLVEIKGAFKEDTDPTYNNSYNVVFDSTTPTTNTSLTGDSYAIQSLTGGINRLLTKDGFTSVGIQKKLNDTQNNGSDHPNRYNYFFIKVRRDKDNPIDVYFVLKDQTVAYFPFDEDNIVENNLYQHYQQDTIMKFDLSSLNDSIDTIIVYNKAASIYEPCHYIDLSNNEGEYDTNNPEGLTQNVPSNVPEADDNICQLGYDYIRASLDQNNLDDDTKSRASAIIIAAYKTPDGDLVAPSYAQYQYIHTFELSKYRCTYFDAKGGKIDGNITFGSSIENRLQEITNGEVQYRLVTSLSNYPVKYSPSGDNFYVDRTGTQNNSEITLLRQYKNSTYTTNKIYIDTMPEGKRFVIRYDFEFKNDVQHYAIYIPLCTLEERDDSESPFYRYGASFASGSAISGISHSISGRGATLFGASIEILYRIRNYYDKDLLDLQNVVISLKTIDDSVELTTNYMTTTRNNESYSLYYLTTYDSNNDKRSFRDVVDYGLDESEYGTEKNIYWGYTYKAINYDTLYPASTATSDNIYSSIFIPNNFGLIDKIELKGITDTYQVLNEYVNVRYKQMLTRYASIPAALSEQYPKLKVLAPVSGEDPAVNYTTDNTINQNKGKVYYTLPNDNYTNGHSAEIYWTEETDDSYFENNSFPMIWMSQAPIDNHDIIGTWTAPIKITGERGEVGASGLTQKFVYCTTVTANESIEHPQAPHILSGNNTVSVDGYNITNEAVGPEGNALYAFPFNVATDRGQTSFTTTGIDGAQFWSRYPTYIDSRYTTRWMSTSVYDEDTETWSAWSIPVIDSRWGEDGRDGASLEYIFYLASAEDGDTVPKVWGCVDNSYNISTASGTYRDANGVKSQFTNEQYSYPYTQLNEVVPTSIGWTDDPQSVSSDYPLQYVSYRKSTYNSYGTKVWGKFSVPIVWNAYSGVGLDGKDGLKGDSTKVIYIKSLSDPGTLSQNKTIPEGWSTVMPSFTQNDRVSGYHIYMSQCIITYGENNTETWSAWSTPIQIDGPEGKAGEDIQYIYSYHNNFGGIYDFTLGGNDIISYLNSIYDSSNHQPDSIFDSNFSRDDYSPGGWSTTPLDISYDHPDLYISYRKISYNLKNTIARNYSAAYQTNNRTNAYNVRHWTEYSTPVRFAHFGDQGPDGCGIEYIYRVYNSNTLPSNLQPKNIDDINTFGYNTTGHKPNGWYNNPMSVNSTDRYLFMSQRKQSTTTSYNGERVLRWGAWSDAVLWTTYSSVGIDGGYHEFIYAILENDYNGGNPTFTSAQELANDSTWSTDVPDTSSMNFQTHAVYMSNCFVTYDLSGNETYGAWSDPIRISGVVGAQGPTGPQGIQGVQGDTGPQGPIGRDGESIEFIYKLTNSESLSSLGTFPYQIYKPSEDSIGQRKSDNMFIPQGWTNNPQGVSQSNRYEWVCMRTKTMITNNQGQEVFGWGEWSNPSLWSKYGENGLDGDGIEYVFLRTVGNIETIDINWLYYVDTNGKTSEQSGFLPWSEVNGVNVQWTDQPSGINEQYPLEWVSIRKWTNSTWGDFSTPQIWSYRGQDGDGFEYVYYRSSTGAPDAPTSSTTIHKLGDPNTYVPPGDAWTEDPRGVNSTYVEEYVSVRHRQANGSWGPYSKPALWGRYTSKGTDGRSLQVAYKIANSKPNAPTNQDAGTTTNGVTTWSGDWTTDMPSSGYNGTTSFLWMTQRFIESDGSYSDWTPVVRISGEKGEPGADGGEIEFLYCRTKSQVESSSFTVPSNSDSNWNNSDFGKDTPTGLSPSIGDDKWSDNPRGLTGLDGFRYEYMICRTKNAGSTFTSFSQPVIWSAWGEKGTDGDGFEYAFCRTTNGQPPTPTSDTVINDNDAQNLADYNVWTDDPRGVNETYPEEYVSVRHKTAATNNQWSNWSTPALWARFTAKGADGSHWVFVYRKDLITATVDAPTAGSTIQNISATWSTELVQLTESEKQAGEAIWMTQCEVDGLDNYGTWSTPIIISGIDGKDGTDGEDGYDGIDGTCIEYIYKSIDDSFIDNGSYNGTHPKDITQKDSSSTGNTKADDDFIPLGWTDHPTGVTETNKYELVSQRIKKHRTVNGSDVLSWGDFTDPVIWSSWGEKGMDGDGYEYIYRLTSESNDLSNIDLTPTDYQTNDTYQQNEYRPSGWTDDPTGIEDDIDKRVEWVSVRKKENGVWGPFSSPAVWARKGSDGDGFEYVYKLANTETDLSNVKLHPDNYLINNNYQNNDEYCSFLADDGHTGWTDDPQGVDASNPNKYVEWVSVRKRKNGVWQEFSAPSIWSRFTAKGSDGRSLQVAYKLVNHTASDINDTPSGPSATNAGTYYTSEDYYNYGNHWYSKILDFWQPDGNLNLIWMSQRYADNGSYTSWSKPVRISGINGAAGADGGDIEFLYCRTKSSTDTPTISGTSDYTYNSKTYKWAESDYGVDKSSNISNNNNGEKGDTRWSDNPRGVTNELKYEWIITRQKPTGGTWGSFTTAVIWSAWGEKGMDGDGYEYVYILTPANVDLSADFSSSHPLNIYDNDKYDGKTKTDDEYLPSSYFKKEGDYSSKQYRWTDDPTGVTSDSDKQKEWVSSRKKTNGAWGAFSRPALWSKWSEKGTTGDSLQIAYKIATSEPSTPSNGAAGTTSGGVTTWTGNWSTQFPSSGYDSTTNFVWMTQRFIQDNGDNLGYSNWTTPIRINGATGPKGDPGSDGGDIEFLYCRTKSTRPTKPTKTSQNETYTHKWHTYTWNDADWGVGQETKISSENGDTEWSDNPQGVTETLQYEWVVQRTKHTGGSWSTFTTPVVWSKWGQKGQDGDGFEYIFYRTTKSTTYVSAPYSNNTDGDVPYGWTDDPQGVTSTSDQQKEWVSKRKKISGGKWSNWSTPAVWAVWAENGADGKDGKNGKNGSYYEYGYQVNNNSTAPTLTSSERSSSSLPNDWNSNAQSISQSNPYLWRIQRQITYNLNSYGQNVENKGYWSSPAILVGKWSKDGETGPQGPQGKNGEDGTDGGTVYALVATKSKCGVYINAGSTTAPFRLETDFEFTVTKIDGNGASTMSQSDLSNFKVTYKYYYQSNSSSSELTLYPSSGKFATSYTGTSNYYQPDMSNSIVRYEFRLKKGNVVVDTQSYDVNVVPDAIQKKTETTISDAIQSTGIEVITDDKNGKTTKTITKWFEYMTKTAKDYLQTYGKTYLDTLITTHISQSATDLSAYITMDGMRACGLDISYNPNGNTSTVSLWGNKVKIKKTGGEDTYAFFDSNGFLNVGQSNGYGVRLEGSSSEGAVVGYNNGTQTFKLRSSGISGIGSRLELGSSGNSYMSESTVCVGGQSGIKLDTASRTDTKFVQVGNTCYFGCGSNLPNIDFGIYNSHGVVSSKGDKYGLIFNNIYKSSSFTADKDAPVGTAYIVGPGVTASVPSGHTLVQNDNNRNYTSHSEGHVAWILIKGSSTTWYTIGAFEQN